MLLSKRRAKLNADILSMGYVVGHGSVKSDCKVFRHLPERFAVEKRTGSVHEIGALPCDFADKPINPSISTVVVHSSACSADGLRTEISVWRNIGTKNAISAAM